MTQITRNDLKTTPLDALHHAHSARMVAFAGYSMPIQYQTGIKFEHLHTRAAAGLFDVSHMGQIRLMGDLAALETLVPADIVGLGLNHQCYSVLTNDNGGIVDDLIIARTEDALALVVNAATRDAVFHHLEHALGERCDVRMVSDRALLALQGPSAAAVLRQFAPGVERLSFMQLEHFLIDDIACLISRSGYTGEDGFEICLDNTGAQALANMLIQDQRVELIGLGARDSLRLEAGLCLAGKDIGAETSIVEAGLGWLVAKKYRGGSPQKIANFPGSTRTLSEIANGSARQRVGVKPLGRAPLREQARLYDAQDNEIGMVTSGSFGPSVDHPTAMAYVDSPSAIPGTQLKVIIRDRTHAVMVEKLPFVPHRYHYN